jgi:hypothetical protein
MKMGRRRCDDSDSRAEARKQKLRESIRTFQTESDTVKSNRQWKQIEKQVFGVEYKD